MNTLQRWTHKIQALVALALCLLVPSAAWSVIVNTATVSYQDAAANSYNTPSNTVTIVTPPVVTSAITATADAGAAFTYQITASNTPTSFGATGLPTGLSVDATGKISGTPSVAGVFAVVLSATNAAGPGTATLTLTIRSAANIVLTKSANVPTAKSGDTVTFTIQYQNTGSGAASAVTITDAIPAGSTLTGPITGGGTAAAGTITWTLGTVASGGAGSVTFQVKVN